MDYINLFRAWLLDKGIQCDNPGYYIYFDGETYSWDTHSGWPFDVEQPDISVLEDYSDNAEQVRTEYEALLKLKELDKQITPRRIAESILTEEGRLWLEALETEKAAIRATISGSGEAEVEPAPEETVVEG
jgi:hypothetical protein